MPFEKVETQVDFPALERAVLKFWDDNGIFEKRQAQNAGKPTWSLPRRPDHRQQPDGRPPRLGPHLQGRVQALLRHDRARTPLPERLRLPGAVGRGRGREGARASRASATSRTSCPATRRRASTGSCRLCKDRVEQVRPRADRADRSASATGWTGTAPTRTGPRRPTSASRTSRWRRRTTTRSGRSSRSATASGLIYRGYDAMPWCGRCGVGISEMEMKEGYKLVEHRAVFVKLPLQDRPGENLLVWTTTPWTLTSNVGAAVNPELTYLKVKLKGEVYYVAKGAFKLNRMEGERGEGDDDEGEGAAKKTRPWLEGRAAPQDHRAALQGEAGKGDSYEIVGEVKGEEMLGWAYDGPFDELPAQQPRVRLPGGGGAGREAERAVAGEDGGAVAPRHQRRQGRDRDRGHRHRPHRPGCGADRLRTGARRTACRRSPRSTTTACFVTGFGALDGQERRRSDHRRRGVRATQGEGPAVRDGAVRPPLPALLAVQDGAALPPRG